MKIGIVGDLHGRFDSFDVEAFNQAGYDLLLCTGDLPGYVDPRETLAVARQLAKLATPAIVMPGNHDVVSRLQFAAEMEGWGWLARLAGMRHPRFHQRLEAALAPVVMGGYSTHRFESGGTQVDVVAARPLAAGGSRLNFLPLLERRYGVRSHEDSVRRLIACVEAARSGHLIILAHNGPFGLGEGPADMWGCDFDPQQGDFGDRDLAEAVAYAQKTGKRVLAVIAGHMHLQTIAGRRYPWRKPVKGPVRPWHTVKDGVHYVNAARVPRVFAETSGVHVRHHILLEIVRDSVSIKEVLVPEHPFIE